MDAHANTSVIGANCRVISYMQHKCNVFPFHPEYQGQEVPIVQAGTTYDDPATGQVYILIINQGLYFGDAMPMPLLNPNQIRMNGIVVDDIPKHLSINPESAMHSIYIPKHDLKIPLEMKGVVSIIPIRMPTVHEIENCIWIEIDWDPHSPSFTEEERKAQIQANTIEVE